MLEINIKKIYNANTGKLPTMDDLKIGQKLTIPALENGTFATNFTGSRVITTEGMGTGTVGSTGSSATTKNYVVKKYDSFWSIAEAKLGKGIRYKEIVKLNNMDENDTLKLGAKLKLPGK